MLMLRILQIIARSSSERNGLAQLRRTWKRGGGGRKQKKELNGACLNEQTGNMKD